MPRHDGPALNFLHGVDGKKGEKGRSKDGRERTQERTWNAGQRRNDEEEDKERLLTSRSAEDDPTAFSKRLFSARSKVEGFLAEWYQEERRPIR